MSAREAGKPDKGVAAVRKQPGLVGGGSRKQPSIIVGILEEELERSARMEARHREELDSLPKGSLQVKVIGGKAYHYRCFREGKKVKSVFVAQQNVEWVRRSIERRREIESSLKRLREDRKVAARALR